jgi:RNA polymerase sigma-70 factor, ECF subfamily
LPVYHNYAVTETRMDTGSCEELAMPLLNSLYNFAHWLTQDASEAEDLAQETCVKALKGFSSFRQGTNFRAWIFKILRNTFLTSRTGLKVDMTSLDDEESGVAEPVAHGTPESTFLAGVDYETIQNALEALTVPYREVIVLCDVEEMSYQEIAETLAVPVGTVMSRLSRARKAVRATLRGQQLRGASR